MGAAASIESAKSIDASDLRETNNLEVSKAEIISNKNLILLKILITQFKFFIISKRAKKFIGAFSFRYTTYTFV